jgi:hypothetical protein
VAEPATTVATTTTTETPQGSWADKLDGEMKPWVSGMGLDKLPPDQALAKVLPMYRGAEQKLGIPADQVIRIPGKDAKPEDWRAVWSKLGAPENPDGYELPVPEGTDGSFAKTAAGWFHELGVPKSAAAAIAQKWNEHVAGMAGAETESWNKRFDEEMNALKGDWKGDEFAKNSDLAKRVMRTGGWTPEQLSAMERALGPRAFLQGFAKFGGMVGEHRFVEGSTNQQFGMSPEQAKQRINDLQNDKAWQASYLNGDADKKTEWTRLHGIAFPETQQAA